MIKSRDFATQVSSTKDGARLTVTHTPSGRQHVVDVARGQSVKRARAAAIDGMLREISDAGGFRTEVANGGPAGDTMRVVETATGRASRSVRVGTATTLDLIDEILEGYGAT